MKNKMRFEVMSQKRAERFRATEPTAIISITSPKPLGYPARLHMHNIVGVLRLEFEDLDREGVGYGWKLFTAEDAKAVWRFVDEQVKGGRCRLIVVHCEAGISRSSAVAAALSNAFYGDGKHFFEEEPYWPNSLVYETMLRVRYGEVPTEMRHVKRERRRWWTDEGVDYFAV